MPNVTNHFHVIGDKLYKHRNHQKNLKGIPIQQTHEISQDIVNGE